MHVYVYIRYMDNQASCPKCEAFVKMVPVSDRRGCKPLASPVMPSQVNAHVPQS